MNSKKRTLLTVLGAIALVATTVLSTVAYLTDTEKVTNTFTVGQVDIKLEETVVDEDGNVTQEKTTEGNQYHLIPGLEYSKDPTMTVLKDSEESYVRMIMTVYNAEAVSAIVNNPVHGLNDFAGLFAGWDNEKWNYVGFEEDKANDTIAFEFRYHEAVGKAEEDKVLEPLFTKLVAPGTLTNEELKALYGDETTDTDDFKIEVVGHAIQKATFETADEAWAAFN